MYEELLKKITTVEFVLDLGFMCDALQELILELQKHNINLYSANNKIKHLAQVSEERRVHPKQYYKISTTAANCLIFQGVPIYKKDRKEDTPICPNSFYENLKISTEKRLLDDEEADLLKWAQVLDPKQWPEEIQNHLAFGETEIRICLQDYVRMRDDTEFPRIPVGEKNSGQII
jgi:hypothetical protein